jgi:glutathione S-transferase
MSNYVLHGHFLSGPTYKVALMLRLSGEAYGFRLLDFKAREHKSAEYLAINRYGQAPCLQEGNDNYFTQSASILEYLAEKHGKFGGKSAQERAHIREWMFWDFDRLAPGIYRSRGYARGIRQGDPAVIKSYRADGEAGLAVLEEWLGTHEWLVGNGPTIADIDVYGVVHLAPEGGAFDLGKYPNILAWMKRLEALPGYAPREEALPKESRL